MKLDKAVLGVMALAFLPVAALAHLGYGGVEFYHHVPSWLELRDLWRAGQYHPGWAAQANFTLGDPRFCYFPPVSFVLGAALAALLPSGLVPAAFVWVVYAASGLSMYYASGAFVERGERWRAAVLYMASPCLMTAALVRFAADEALAMAWLPWVVLLAWRLFASGMESGARQARVRISLMLGCLLALTWITSLPAALVLLYVLLPTVGFVALWRRSPDPLFLGLIAVATSVGLAAFFVAPAWFERGWIQGGAAFAHISVAVVASRYVPRLLAVPYRSLAPLWAVLPLLLLAQGTPKRRRVPGYVLLGLVLLIAIWQYGKIRPDLVKLPAFTSAAQQWQQDGYPGWPAYAPVAATPLLRPLDLPPATVVDPAQRASCSVEALPTDGVLTRGQPALETGADAPCQIRLAVNFYPFWRPIDEGGIPLPTARDVHGLLLITVPVGEHRVRLTFHVSSKVRTVSLVVSVFAALAVLIALLGGAARARKQREKPAPEGAHAPSAA